MLLGMQRSYLCSANGAGDEFAASDSSWDSLTIRHTFIRKVKPAAASLRGLRMKEKSVRSPSSPKHGGKRQKLKIKKSPQDFCPSKTFVLTPGVSVSQVYLILTCQLLVTTAIVSVFVFV